MLDGDETFGSSQFRYLVLVVLIVGGITMSLASLKSFIANIVVGGVPKRELAAPLISNTLERVV